jgi:flagellar M-ring protein FliF
MDRARTLFTSLTPRGRIALLATGAAVLVFALFFFKMATKPSYTTLVSGVDPAETGKITGALSEKGIKFELQNSGTAIGVEKAKVSEARIALAEQGLPGTSKPGFELFDKQKLGASEFQQRVTYQRALEGEIARTIGEVDGISGVQVQLTLPEDELFVDEEKPATAAVLLSGASDLDPGTVRGIARLTASSVEGLKPDDVTITDSSGRLLWPTGEGGEAGVGSTTKQAVEARYERSTEAAVNAMLMQTVGPGKARVQVNADVNADQSTQEQLTYAKKGTPISKKTETETLEGGGSGAPAGTAGNVPSYAQGAAAGGASNYKRKTEDVQNGVNKTVTRTTIAPGEVERQSVALLLDKSVAVEQVPELRNAVEAAVGLDEERGDVLSVSQVPFAKVEDPKAGPVPGGMLGLLKWVGLGIGTLVFLILMARQLRKRESEELAGEPVWLREIQMPHTLAQLEEGGYAQPAMNLQNFQQAGPSAERQLVEDASSERLAHQVRAWMKS